MQVRVHNRDVAPEDRVDAWRERVQALLHPLDVFPLDRGKGAGFLADFRGVRAASSAATGTMGPARTVVRPAQAGDAPSRRIQLYVQNAGPAGRLEARGEVRHPRRGALLIETADEARQSMYPGTIRTTVLDIDANELSIPWQVLRESAFRRITIGQGMRDLVSGAVDVSASDQFTPAMADSYLLGVAEVTLRSALDMDPDHAGTTFMRVTYAKLFIESHCGDTNLTATQVAGGVGISTRRLHQLFATTDSAVGQYIHLMRIRRARALLEAPHTREWTIAKIAHHCGFRSRSHFSKAFTAATGHSPSDHRNDP